MELLGVEESPIKGEGKAWVNRAFESNPVPAIWISKRVGHIAPAYLRRFDFVLEVPKPCHRPAHRSQLMIVTSEPLRKVYVSG